MHGRLKVRTSAEQAAAKQKEREKKMKIYNEVTEKIFTKRRNNEMDKEALELTEQILAANPDFTTLWNFRRETFLAFKEKRGFDSKLEECCKKELLFLQSCLKVNPKSYSVWHHRQWINEFMPHPNWKQEMQLCNLFLSFDERNFHCWDYRRTVVKKAKITPEEEFKFSTDKIVENFSNYSSWHYRSKLLPLMHPHESGNPERIEEEALLREFELAQNAFFTDPNDQSAWFYHRWLLGRAQIPLDVTCTYINTDHKILILSFSQLVKVSLLSPSVVINNQEVQGTWRNVFSSCRPCYIWIFDFDMNDTIRTVNVTITLREKKVTKSVSVGKGEIESWALSSDSHLLRAELTAIHSSLLENELDSCKMLLEEEPDNKWTIFTIVLLMRALDALTYQDETNKYLTKLCQVDPSRRGYYDDLCKKFALENAIEKYWKETNNITGCKRSINLSNMGLTNLYHMQQLLLVNTVDLSSNELTNLDQCNALQCTKTLIVSSNKLQTISLRLNQLEELIVNKNCIKDVISLETLKDCPRLKKLDLRDNEVCSLVDYRMKVKDVLPFLRYLDNEPL
ncbi:geranylgeranyl transferase type-2 subunit alpha isoform X2 [Exaiptasia diaphana]|uniref:Geranylgeranyl transferase type-2 subunit alpha n=1 Tax=Exaiptasia diaphana TaxID=2652724 RepID=A0A913WRA3_EXADI|nr:geranylgeranyl transferase type-2 subunit alpha isoform X2 [Exaiptasia diaphana]KXJ18539.1 Geranylgeranyl transferase type-2 subunit alpha [Exaiptasia diaphana]